MELYVFKFCSLARVDKASYGRLLPSQAELPPVQSSEVLLFELRELQVLPRYCMISKSLERLSSLE
jgi:hypothetical protein